MNVSMWLKALQVIPRLEKDQWQELDIISRWLIAVRSAVLVITFISEQIFAYAERRAARGVRDVRR